MRIDEIVREIEEAFPLRLQESYDNCGYQVGNPEGEALGVLTTLDITEAVLEEAVQKGCNLVIAHHPLLFHPLKQIVGQSYIERSVQFAIKNELTIYAAHTNLDNGLGGINYRLAQDLGLTNLQVLEQRAGEAVGVGSGIIGDLPASIDFGVLVEQLRAYFTTEQIRYSVSGKEKIRRVAICGGAGAFLWRKARELGADIFITGEAKYNDYFDVEGHPRLLTVGHYESERVAIDIFARIISEKFPTFAVYKTDLESNPIKSV